MINAREAIESLTGQQPRTGRPCSRTPYLRHRFMAALGLER